MQKCWIFAIWLVLKIKKITRERIEFSKTSFQFALSFLDLFYRGVFVSFYDPFNNFRCRFFWLHLKISFNFFKSLSHIAFSSLDFLQFAFSFFRFFFSHNLRFSYIVLFKSSCSTFWILHGIRIKKRQFLCFFLPGYCIYKK